MANQNGKKYGFTGLFPIATNRSDDLRAFLRTLDDVGTYPRGSPFSHVPIIHMARLFIVDRLAYQGTPAKFDQLKSDYLVFMCEFDGESVDPLVQNLASNIPNEVATIWGRCLGFPGIQRRDQLAEYFEQCQLETTLFLADQPEASVTEILMALLCRRRLGEFVKQVQSRPLPPDVLQREFRQMWESLQNERPLPGDL
ncbi:hypothetical protein I6F35_38260 [Bradyrhizobium sp. BRP22]|uniref:hypothetical protein n=1 Tax=Bradyrhizobium sp. BRP22 TaxID=2793821 RepID=UPI001CD68AF6|nr:hypothetical protein [Bradyrhizobium sp. BRP22]MCA1458905.1 hypothetical protein [Bradyrhizobium sp. BRP22]